MIITVDIVQGPVTQALPHAQLMAGMNAGGFVSHDEVVGAGHSDIRNGDGY